MSDKIKLNTAELKVNDCIKYMNDNDTYKVTYICLLTDKATIVSTNYADTTFTLDLDDENFEII